MMRQYLLMCCVMIGLVKTARAKQYSFDYTPLCAQAYKVYLALKPKQGDSLIFREVVANPYNLMATYISDYGDFLTLVFNGDPHERAERDDHEDERIKRLELADDSEPWKRVALAGVHMHWALIHIRYGERLKGALAFRRSYLALKENAARFPKFMPTSVLYGIEEAMAGTIPDGYKWLMNLFGMKGNLTSGMTRLSSYLKQNPSDESPLHEEALIYNYYTRFYLGADKAAVWASAGSDAAFSIKGNILRCFIRANIALSYRKADAAANAMRIAKLLPGADTYPALDYELGSALFLQLESDCTTYLERFAARNTGRLFTKDALYKSALAWYLKSNNAKAAASKASILQNGSLITDADNNAQRFAKEGHWPQHSLLQAKLLTDGGYYPKALVILRATSANAFAEEADRIEYDFRLGRALEEAGDVAQAVQYYQRVINAGRKRKEEFAARAAVQMANIYEERKQTAEAKKYFNICLSMSDHDFQNQIDQQAKAGLARLERGG